MKKTLKLVFAALLALLIVPSAFSQEFDDEEDVSLEVPEVKKQKSKKITVNAAPRSAFDLRNELGFYLDTVAFETGSGGIQYQHWFNNWFGFGLEGWMYANPSVSSDSDFSFSTNGRFLYNIVRMEPSKTFASQCYGWGLFGLKCEWSDIENYSGSEEFDYAVRFGTGVSYELIFRKYVSLACTIGLEAELGDTKSVAGVSGGTSLRFRY